MNNFDNEDKIVKSFDFKIMKRLLKYSIPYAKHFIFVIILMFIATGLNLWKPIIIKNTIDNNLNGYKKNYTILSSPASGSVKVNNIYVIKGNIDGGKPASIVNKGSSYYIVNGVINHNKPYSIDSSKVTQDNKTYDTYKIESSTLKILRQDDLNGVFKSVIYILVISIALFAFNYLQMYLLNYTGQKIVFTIRKELFKHIESLSLSFYDKNPVGRLVTRVTNDVETLNEMYTDVLVNLLKDAFTLVGILVAMFLLNFKLGIIALCVLPVVIIITIIFRKYDRDAYRDVRVKIARINSSMSENISGMKTVQIYHKEAKKFKEFDGINRDYYNATRRQVTVFAIFRPAIDFISALSLSALLWFGGREVLSGYIQFGVLYAFVSYMQQFFQPISDFTEKYDVLQSAMASAERIFMLLDTNDKIKNPKNPVAVKKFKGEIEFKSVWFAYIEDQWVLRDVSFKIEPGETAAFVGATGAGKTSIISLLTRLYDIQKGEILIDGINIKSMNKEDLRKNISTVLQDVFLFSGNIKNNIRLNNNDITDDEIIKVCKYINADKFIEKLPSKYDSYVNERGSTFSQGQRQLIAFARAIAFNPPVLILDEATASIDTETESLIQDALSKITKGRTTIVVAHRLSTIKNADKIIVLNKGKIKEIGNHKELLEKKGLYYNLYQLQYRDLEK